MIVTDVATNKRETTDMVHVITEEPDRAYAPNVWRLSMFHTSTTSRSVEPFIICTTTLTFTRRSHRIAMFVSNEIPPGSSGWETLSGDLEESALETKIRFIIRSTNNPWHDIGLLPKSPMDVCVLNALQKVLPIRFIYAHATLILPQELDEAWKDDPQYFTACFRCLHALTKARDLFPESFVVNEGVVREPGYPIDGGEASVRRCEVQTDYMLIAFIGHMERNVGREGCMLEGISDVFNDSRRDKDLFQGAVDTRYY